MSTSPASAYFFKPDRLPIPDAWPLERSFRNDNLPATRLSVSEMSYFNLLVICDMVIAKPREVQHTIRATLITQRSPCGFRDDFSSPAPLGGRGF